MVDGGVVRRLHHAALLLLPLPILTHSDVNQVVGNWRVVDVEWRSPREVDRARGETHHQRLSGRVRNT